MPTLIYSPLFLEHGDPSHPENRRRLEAIMAHLESSGWLDRLTPLDFGPATVEQIAWLHEEDYIETVAEVCEEGGGAFTMDTLATSQTYAAAALAVGGCIAAAEAAVAGKSPRSMCLVRPPGHHAYEYGAFGFCFFNNVALAAEAALQSGLTRVAIVDFDVHHGNGTQDMFYHRRDVLYVSLHELPLFPGTGSLDEVGVEDGAGFTINLPLLAGACDRHYATAFDEVIVPALDAYQPELLLVSAGYDAHHSDLLAHMNLSLEAYYRMSKTLVGAAERHAQGRIVIVLEGGYDLDWLPRSVDNTLRALAGEGPLDFADIPLAPHAAEIARVNDALDHVITTHKNRLSL